METLPASQEIGVAAAAAVGPHLGGAGVQGRLVEEAETRLSAMQGHAAVGATGVMTCLVDGASQCLVAA